MGCKHEDVEINEKTGVGTCRKCGATSEVGMGWSMPYLVFDCDPHGLPLGKLCEVLVTSSEKDAASAWSKRYEEKFKIPHLGYIRVTPLHESVTFICSQTTTIKRTGE